MATVSELIEALQGLNPEAEVYLEGCDCENEWNGEIGVPHGHSTAILLER